MCRGHRDDTCQICTRLHTHSILNAVLFSRFRELNVKTLSLRSCYLCVHSNKLRRARSSLCVRTPSSQGHPASTRNLKEGLQVRGVV